VENPKFDDLIVALLGMKEEQSAIQEDAREKIARIEACVATLQEGKVPSKNGCVKERTRTGKRRGARKPVTSMEMRILASSSQLVNEGKKATARAMLTDLLGDREYTEENLPAPKLCNGIMRLRRMKLLKMTVCRGRISEYAPTARGRKFLQKHHPQFAALPKEQATEGELTSHLERVLESVRRVFPGLATIPSVRYGCSKFFGVILDQVQVQNAISSLRRKGYIAPTDERKEGFLAYELTRKGQAYADKYLSASDGDAKVGGVDSRGTNRNGQDREQELRSLLNGG